MADRQTVETVLTEIGLFSLVDNFRKQKVEFFQLNSLSDNELTRLGLTTIGDRVRLREKLRELKESNTTTQFSDQARVNTVNRNIGDIGRERQLLFSRRGRSSHKRTEGRLRPYTMTAVCLSDRNSNKVPTADIKEVLLKAGLGCKKIQFTTSDNLMEKITSDVRDENNEYVGFPQLKHCGGFELLRCQGNSRVLTIIDCPWTVKSLKTFLGTQAKVYIRPIQQNLCTEPLQAEAVDSGLKELCRHCGLMVQLRNLRSHCLESCQETLTLYSSGQDTTVAGNLFVESAQDTTVAGNMVVENAQYAAVAGNMVVENAQYAAVAGNMVVESAQYAAVAGNMVVESAQDAAVAGNMVVESAQDSAVAGNMVVESAQDTAAAGNLIVESAQDTAIAGNLVVESTQDSFVYATSETNQAEVDFQSLLDLQPDVDLTSADIETYIEHIVSMNIHNPVEMLRYLQSVLVTGRKLDIDSPDNSIEGYTNFINIDRHNILETAFDEIRAIYNPRLTLEVQFYNEMAHDFGGPRKEFFQLVLGAIKEKYFDNGLREHMKEDYITIGKIFSLSILQNGKMPFFIHRYEDEIFSTTAANGCITNLRTGLEWLGLHTIGVILPSFRHILRPTTTSMTVRLLTHLLRPAFSETGSNSRVHESKVYSAYTRYLREAAGGRRGSVTLRHILKFATGAEEEPLLGFSLQPTIQFTEVSLSFVPTANTCANTMNLPRPTTYTPLPPDQSLFNFYDLAFSNTFFGLV